MHDPMRRILLAAVLLISVAAMIGKEPPKSTLWLGLWVPSPQTNSTPFEPSKLEAATREAFEKVVLRLDLPINPIRIFPISDSPLDHPKEKEFPGMDRSKK
jgi:hypothetical protein